MSEWATALKIGTTALVLDLIERGKAPQLEIAQPVKRTKAISRDQGYTLDHRAERRHARSPRSTFSGFT